MSPAPPDVVVVGPEWPERALLRAQLIDEGCDVVACDAWPIPREYLRHGMKPRVLIVDLRGLAEPRGVLDEVRYVVPPDRVLVVTALGTLPADDIRAMGFHVVTRPVTVGEIVSAAAALLRIGTDPDRGCTDRDRGCTDPDRNRTDPDRGCTDPDRGCTDPDRGCTDPDRGCTDTGRSRTDDR
ncbi:MAG: hypothetical protein HY657_01205 [Acidobacteria bacterium]|nr:hypothetical protein [Acidobacteriota bacterium]